MLAHVRFIMINVIKQVKEYCRLFWSNFFISIEFLIFLNCADQYPWAGQNIAYRGNTGGYEDPNLSIQQMIDSWFSEYKSANMNNIHAYPVHGPR